MPPRTLEEKLRTLANTRLGTIVPFSQGVDGRAFMDHVDSAYDRKHNDGDGADHDSWSEGVCYGLSMMFLFGAKAGKERTTLSEIRDELRKFADAPAPRPQALGSGMLEYLAHLHVMQESGVSMLKKRGVQVPDKAMKLLGRGARRQGEDPTDALMRESGLRPWPDDSGEHERDFEFELPDKSTMAEIWYGREANAEAVQQMVAFMGKPGAYSYVHFREQRIGGGHAMAALGRTHGCTFFDPNWGSATFPFNSTMVGFLRRTFPYAYFYKPKGNAPRDPRTMPSKLSHGEARITSLTLKVRRYR